jgi:hypothetical protein
LRAERRIMMFIKTMRDFQKYIQGTERCGQCGKLLRVPPVIMLDLRRTEYLSDEPPVITSEVRQLFHLSCARNLAYAILYELTGKPDTPQEAFDKG